MTSDKTPKNLGEKQFSIQPVPGAEKHQGLVDPRFAVYQANLGPVINEQALSNVPLEGTKEEIQKRMEELNKK